MDAADVVGGDRRRRRCHAGTVTDAGRDPIAETWTTPPPVAAHRATGRAARARLPRERLADLTVGDRDPLGILDRQNATRVAELLPLRTERMAASAFAFFRGTAAIMAADLAADPHTRIAVASCGDAHVANFGLYASPQRTLVFDLNDFDEAAWAPWEWDLKRLITSVVIAGQSTSREQTVVSDAALSAVRAYARAMSAGVEMSPTARYFAHFDLDKALSGVDAESRAAMHKAMRDAEKRTAEKAVRKLTAIDATGRRVFVETPPTMTHAEAAIEARVQEHIASYVESAGVDIQMLLQSYVVAHVARRVVGVGSVGTRCHLAVLQDGDGNALLLQTKEANRSVLAEYGGITQPPVLAERVARNGEGARVVGLQRVLQAFSDPFLGHLQTAGGDFYVRQFRDMKGGVDIETLDDEPFAVYAQSCAITLARAHAQSPNAAAVAGYLGGGRVAASALLAWAEAYAEVSRHDYEAFRARSADG